MALPIYHQFAIDIGRYSLVLYEYIHFTAGRLLLLTTEWNCSDMVMLMT